MEKTKSALRQWLEILFSHQAFRIVLLIMVTLRSSHLLSPYVGPLVKFTLAWSAVILIKDLFTQRLLLVNRWRGWLYLFLILYGVTTLVQREQNFARNVAMLLYMATNLLLFYSYDLSKERDAVKKEIWNLSHTFMILTFLGNLISLAAFVLNVHYRFDYGADDSSWLGFYSGRMWGFFSNPNTGGDIAIFNMMLMAICLIMAGKSLSKGWKRFYVVNAVVQSILFFISNSRTSWMCAIFFILAATFLSLLFRIPERVKTLSVKQVVKRTAAVALAAVFAFVGLDSVAKDVLPYAIIPTTYFSELLASLPGSDMPTESEDPDFEAVPTDLERDSYGSSLGGRFYLWKAGVGIVANYPLLGVTSENIEYYAEQYAEWPTSYEQAQENYKQAQLAQIEQRIADAERQLRQVKWQGSRAQIRELEDTIESLQNAKLTEYEAYLPGITGGLHNMIIQIAASSGLPALLVIGIVAVGFLVLLVRYFIYACKRRQVSPLVTVMAAFILTMLVRSMSETGLIYGISYSSILFWSFVSYTVYFIEKETAGEPSFEKGRRTVLARLTGRVFGGRKGR